jgi:hypothetical protein
MATRNFHISPPGHGKNWDEDDHEELIDAKKTPNWYYCNADRFEHYWLEGWEGKRKLS